MINGPLNNLTNMPNKRLPGLQKCSKIGCSALCLFRSANVYCLYCCYRNENSIVLDFYFDIIKMFVSWEWQQRLDSYLETYASYGLLIVNLVSCFPSHPLSLTLSLPRWQNERIALVTGSTQPGPSVYSWSPSLSNYVLLSSDRTKPPTISSFSFSSLSSHNWANYAYLITWNVGRILKTHTRTKWKAPTEGSLEMSSPCRTSPCRFLFVANVGGHLRIRLISPVPAIQAGHGNLMSL